MKKIDKNAYRWFWSGVLLQFLFASVISELAWEWSREYHHCLGYFSFFVFRDWLMEPFIRQAIGRGRDLLHEVREYEAALAEED